MPFEFTCPHCGFEKTVQDEYAGQRGPCAACGKDVTVEPPTPVTTVAQSTAKPPARPGGALGFFLLAAAAVLLIAGFVAALVFIAVPATQVITQTGGLNTCNANLVKIGQAMLAYEQEHGALPPAYLQSPGGVRLHSWRVLLLPYLGEDKLYEQYSFADDIGEFVGNQFLANQRPDVYGCPDDLAPSGTETSYVVVNGPGYIFDGAESCSLADITDGPAETILVVEVAGSTIGWIEPRDLDSRAASLTINAGGESEIGSFHTGGAHVLFADGHVEFLPDTITTEKLHALLTKDAGDSVE